MASASVTSATARGNVVFPRAGMSRSFRAQPGRPPSRRSRRARAVTSSRAAPREECEGRTASPARGHARREAQRDPGGAGAPAFPHHDFFLTTIPPGFPTTRAARSALARATPPSALRVAARPPSPKPSLHPRRVCLTPRTTATRAASASSASSTKPPRARTWSKRSDARAHDPPRRVRVRGEHRRRRGHSLQHPARLLPRGRARAEPPRARGVRPRHVLPPQG